MAKDNEPGAESKSIFDLMGEARNKMRPREGFNLVGLDDFEDFGDELYFIANYPTLEKAVEARDRRLARNPSEDLIIYDVNGLCVEYRPPSPRGRQVRPTDGLTVPEETSQDMSKDRDHDPTQQYEKLLEETLQRLENAGGKLSNDLFSLAMLGPLREWNERQAAGTCVRLGTRQLLKSDDPKITALARLLDRIGEVLDEVHELSKAGEPKSASWLQVLIDRQSELERSIPKGKFGLIGIDAFEPAQANPYLIAIFDTHAEAEQALSARAPDKTPARLYVHEGTG